MLAPLYILLVYLSICEVHANTHEPEEYIKLTLGVSKASYLPFSNGRYLQNGFVMENPFFSSYAGDFPEHDEPACSIGGWTAKSYENQDVEALMFTNIQQKLVVFGFRGTELASSNDLQANAEILLVQASIESYKFRIHKGFLARYDHISSWFENEYSYVPNDYTILLTGHSSGGAHATIAAVYAAGKLNRIPDAVVTYGSPKVGNKQFKDYYRQVVGCDRTIRMVSSNDPSPNVPWSFLGYTHVCSAVEVVGNTSLNPLYPHSMYGAYEDGISKKFKNMNKINIGCDQV